MRNVICNDKPTYAELETLVKNHDKLSIIALAVILVLMVACTMFLAKSIKWESEATFHQEMSEIYKRASERPNTTDFEQKALWEKRYTELQEAEFNLQIRKVQEEAFLKLSGPILHWNVNN